MTASIIPARFWVKVNKNGPIPAHKPELGPCWVWISPATTVDGYGCFRVGGRTRRAHRWLYEQLVGPIPEGLTLDHLCRVHPCVKAIADEHGPSHLEPTTRRENTLRGDTLPGRNARKTHCKRGHPFDLLNTYWAPNGQRVCRICRRVSQRKWEEARLAA